MPAMSGLDLLRAIKENNPDQIVVVMTGYDDKEVILRALKAGADDFFSKPVDILQLRTTIDKVLEKRALKEQLGHLRYMDRLKSDFLGLISHKLKTPITSISLFIQNLAHGIGNPADPSFQKTLDLILKESDYLSYLIRDLLLYSEVILQEGPPQIAETDLRDLAAAVVAQQHDAAQSKGVRLQHSLPRDWVPMRLDRQRITFAIGALLDNAVKFTPPGGTVSLTGTSVDGATLILRDTGPGIPPEEMPKIFEKFYQVDPDRAGQVRGFGLGLYYARQFIQGHGGSLRLTSEPGRGTKVVINLPGLANSASN
jgi:signal transduction histidine kinase